MFKLSLLTPFAWFCLFQFVLPCATIGQLSLAGRVVNGSTGLPLSGASVYFNNTSIGTSSNDKGEFSFSNVDLGNSELVVSSIGFEILVVKINANLVKGKFYLCQLTPKEEQLKDVLVLSDARRKRLLEIFKENFLGHTREADKSSMQNLKSIYFTRGSSGSGFNAYTDTPIIITNNQLGYRVSFQLVEFSFDEATGITYFIGYTRYEELGDKKRWIKNRQDAYFGSTLHFFRSFISNRLNAEGYDLYLVKPVGNTENKSSAEMAMTITPSQISSANEADTGYLKITVPGKLMVQYRRNPPSKNYLARKMMVMGSMPLGFRAFINLTEPYFLVDRNGILEDPLAINYGGYWIYERAANLLPFNYQPGN